MTLLLSLVATPLLLRWLGEERLGAFRAAIEWMGYVALLEFGIGGALAATLNRAAAAGEASLARAVVEGIRAYLRALILMVLGAVVLIAAAPWLIRVSAELRWELRVGLAFSAVGVLLLPFSVFRIALDATQRGYWVNVTLILQAVLVTALSLLLAYLGWGLVGQFAALLAGAGLFAATTMMVALRRMGGVASLRAGHDGDTAAREQLRSLNWPTFFSGLSGRVGLMSDNIVIAAFLGPAAVTAFFLTQRLIAVVQGQLGSVGSAVWAAMAEMHHRGEHDRRNARLLDLTRLVAVMGCLTLVPIVVFNRGFIRLWVGTEQYAGDLVSVLAALNAVILAVLSVWGWMFGGTGRVRITLPVSLVGAGVNLAGSLTFTAWLGVPGPLLGTLVAMLAVHAWAMPMLLARHDRVPPWRLVGAALFPLLVGALYGWGVWVIGDPHGQFGRVGLLLRWTIAAAGFVPLGWWLIGPELRIELWRRLRVRRGKSSWE